MTRVESEGLEWGDCVDILGSGVLGFVIAITFHMRCEATYLVEYIDGTGSPQERWWSESQLTLVGDDTDPLEQYGAEPRETHSDKVVPLRKLN